MHHQLTFLLACLQVSSVVSGLDMGQKPLQRSLPTSRIYLTYSEEFNTPIQTMWSQFTRFDLIRLWDSGSESSCLISKPFTPPQMSANGTCLIQYNGDTPIGSVRDVRFADKHVYEKLVLLNAKTFQISYRIQDYPPANIKSNPFPGSISDEQTDITLYSLGPSRTKIIWVANFLTDMPAPMYDVFHGIYQGHATGLRKITNS